MYKVQDLMMTAEEARALSDTQKMVNQAILSANKAVEEAAKLGKKNTYFYMNDDEGINYQSLVKVVSSLYKLGFEIKILLFVNPEIQLCWDNEATDMPVIVDEELGKEDAKMLAEMIDKEIEGECK